MIPAIVLGSQTQGLAVIRALGAMGVPVVAVVHDEAEECGFASKYVKEVIPAPHPAHYEEQYIQLLTESSARLDNGVLIPTADETVVAVSRHKALLERHYVVAATDWDITEKYIDKKHTYALADAIGVPAPKTIIPRSRADVESYGTTVEYPCLVKPSQSHLYSERFRRKMVRVENLEQLLAAYQEAADAGLEVMLQELIPGPDSNGVNYNAYFWNSEPLVEFTAAKVRSAPPGVGAPRVVVSKHIPEVIEPGRKMLRALGFSGFACTEFKRDARNGVYKLMEVNGRHNLSGILAVRCGINFPWIHYRHLACNEVPSAADYRTGVYWIELIKDVGHSLKSLRQENFTLSQLLEPYRSPHVFAILEWQDPKPFVLRGFNLAKKAWPYGK